MLLLKRLSTNSWLSNNKQIFNFLTNTNIFYRNFKLVGDCKHHATLCGSIQFGNGQRSYVGCCSKMSGLFQCILTGTSIQYQQHFVRSIRKSFFITLLILLNSSIKWALL